MHAPSHNCGKTNEKKEKSRSYPHKIRERFLGPEAKHFLMILLISNSALIWWRFIKCTFHFDRVHTNKLHTQPKMSGLKMLLTIYCVCILSASMCVMILKAQFVWWTTFVDCKKWYLWFFSIEEYITSIKQLRKLYTTFVMELYLLYVFSNCLLPLMSLEFVYSVSQLYYF